MSALVVAQLRSEQDKVSILVALQVEDITQSRSGRDEESALVARYQAPSRLSLHSLQSQKYSSRTNNSYSNIGRSQRRNAIIVLYILELDVLGKAIGEVLLREDSIALLRSLSLAYYALRYIVIVVVVDNYKHFNISESLQDIVQRA